MEAHPAANLLPPMTDAALAALAADIGAAGLLEPIVTYEGRILDGRSRYRACGLAGVEPRFREWDGKGGSPVAFVISQNVQRRHLTPSQLAAIAVDALPLFEAEARERQGARTDLQATAPESHGSQARDQAAALTGASPRYVQEAKAVKKKDPELFEKVVTGEVTLRAAGRELGRTPGGKGGGHQSARAPRGANKDRLTNALDPLDRYFKSWTPYALRGITPGEARALLRKVRRIDAGLLELERALEARTVVPHAIH